MKFTLLATLALPLAACSRDAGSSSTPAKASPAETAAAPAPKPPTPAPAPPASPGDAAGAPSVPPAPAPTPAPVAEPDRIKVQHCLIGFQNSVRGKAITRTKEDAKTLAYAIFERAKKGEDFDALVKQHTDDAHPGIYGMTNTGKSPVPGYYARTGMVPAFGNVGFKLAPGAYGIADYDPQSSPFGWHVIKRVE